MQGKAIIPFTDLQDNNYAYKTGDLFPRQGLTVSKDRFEELASSKNKSGKPVIVSIEEKKQEAKIEEHIEETQVIQDPVAEDTSIDEQDELIEETATVSYKKSDIMSMRKNDLVALATKNGIGNAEEMSGNELKKQLIEILGL